jgi:hypothetical protein
MNGKSELIRRAVAIAGRVLDGGTGKPLGDAEVMIMKPMPKVFEKRLEIAALPFGKRWDKMWDRPDRTRTRPDGLFYFMDLPDGEYSLQAALPSMGRRFGSSANTARVSRDAEGNIEWQFVRLVLQPTQVKGRVTGATKEAVALARVRVKGSGERGFTDAQGYYMVAGIEPGTRTLQVSAQGYGTLYQEFTVGGPGESQELNIPLKRENG